MINLQAQIDGLEQLLAGGRARSASRPSSSNWSRFEDKSWGVSATMNGPRRGRSNSLVMHPQTVWQLLPERGRAADSTALRMRWPTSMRRSGLGPIPPL